MSLDGFIAGLESDPRVGVAAQAWGDDPPFHHPVFVLTHHAREPLLEQARAAAADREVAVAGGADVMQRDLEAGLIDEMQLRAVPLMLGHGLRLFDGQLRDAPSALECTREIESPTGVTHLQYRAAS